MPRTSTPIPDVPEFTEDEVQSLSEHKDPYVSWKKYLLGTKGSFKIRGTPIIDREVVSGHFMMEDNRDMMSVHRNFINLLLNRPNPEELLTAKEEKKVCRSSVKFSAMCYQFCECNRFSERNVDLPIGFRVDENGYIVQSRVQPLVHFD